MMRNYGSAGHLGLTTSESERASVFQSQDSLVWYSDASRWYSRAGEPVLAGPSGAVERFLERFRQRIGPVSHSQLQDLLDSGIVSPSTHVWTKRTGWMRLEKFLGLYV